MFQQSPEPTFDPTAALLQLLKQQKSRAEYNYLAGFINHNGFFGGQVKVIEEDAGVVRETTINVAVFAHCGHRVMSFQDIGFWCPCKDIVCPQCSYTCEVCLNNFCQKHVTRYDGQVVCENCELKLGLKKAAGWFFSDSAQPTLPSAPRRPHRW